MNNMVEAQYPYFSLDDNQWITGYNCVKSGLDIYQNYNSYQYVSLQLLGLGSMNTVAFPNFLVNLAVAIFMFRTGSGVVTKL
jgi:hypothetical protein